ncbi:MAG: amidohydrolase family protein, partial [candidate division Zixibacteria bacterium]|nr:amidohydrolase family protein [candidate division Zixibacteria bacterium]
NNEVFVFETSDKLSLLRADRIAQEFGRSFIYIGSGKEYERIDDIAATGAKIILPINYPKTPEVGSFEDELDVSLASLRHWETAPSNPSILEKRNITFALTTHGLKKKKTFLTNLRKAIKRGLSKKTALASLTTVPAELCGVEQFTGTLEKGKLANFSIWDKEIFEKKAKIYSVWIAGQKHELKPIPEHDFKGEYALDIDGVDFELEISGKPEKLSGTLELGEEKEYKLKNVEVQGPKLMFSVKLDTLELIGTFRFSGRIKDSSYVGKFTRPDGTRQNFAAAALEESAEDEAEDDADSTDSENEVEEIEKDKKRKKKSDDQDDVDDDEEKLIAKLTFPNRAYGLETLPQQENVLIKNATIWTSEAAGILENYDLLIKDGKFAALGQNLKAPAGVRVIDATGKHLTAGIIDEHSHIAISGGVNECTDAVTCEVRIGDVINSDDLSIYRQLAGGTTTAQLLHGSCNPIGGQAQIIKHRWGSSTEEMKFKNAPPTVKFALGENVKHSNFGDKFTVRYPQTRMGVETLIKDECQAAREYDADWAAYDKLSGGAKKRTVPPRRDLELEAMSDIVNSRMFIHCHSYHQSEILMLMRVAEEYNFHIQTFTHILEGYKVAPEMAAHGATASTFADWWAYKFEVYDAIPYNMVLMTKAGVVTSINSDNGDLGRRLNQDAAKAVMYGGMSQEEAIKLATLNPAIQLKIDDRVGSIKVGKDADFVIWNNNPLSVYAKAEQTWVDGKKYFDLESDLAMRAAIKKEKQALIQKVLAKSDGKKNGDDKPKRHWGERNNFEDYQWQCDDNFDYWEKVNK